MTLFDNQSPEDIVYLSSNKIARELRHSEPQIKKPLDFSKISGIKKAAPELQKYIEDIDSNETPDDDIIVGGSSAAFTQVKRIRVPKDLDISTPYLNKEVRNIAAILRQKYGANKVVITPKFTANIGGKKIEVVQIGIGTKDKYVEAVDIKHEINDGFMSVSKHPSVKIGRIFVEPIGYLIERKAAAIKQYYSDEIKRGNLPKPRMKKDIDDFKAQASSVPDFHTKNLQLYMTAFEQNLLHYKEIPKAKPKNRFKDQPQSQPNNLFGGVNDPFGAGGFFMRKESVEVPPKKKKLNPLQITGFKLW